MTNKNILKNSARQKVELSLNWFWNVLNLHSDSITSAFLGNFLDFQDRYFQNTQDWCIWVGYTAGVQPECFQGRGVTVELGHFNKHFVENARKRPRRKIFSKILLKLHFEWKFNPKMDTISFVHRWVFCSNRPAYASVSVKRVEVVETS